MATQKFTFLGRGVFNVGAYDGSTPLSPAGNVSKLDLAVTAKSIDMPDYQNPGGGNYDSVQLIDKASLDMSLMEISPANAAIGLFGTASTVAGGAVVAEPIDGDGVKFGSLVPFLKVPDPSVAYVIKSTGGSPTTYVAGTDYLPTRSGIIPMSTGSITEGEDLTAGYTSVSSNNIEGLTTTGKLYKGVFEGLNEAQSGKSVIVTVYQMKIPPAKALSLISDTFAQLDVTAEILKDVTRSGAGLSQYVSIKMQA